MYDGILTIGSSFAYGAFKSLDRKFLRFEADAARMH